MMKQKYVYRNHEGEREMMNGLLVVIEVFSVICQRIYTQKILTRRNDNRIMEYCIWGSYFIIFNYITYHVSNSAWGNILIFNISFFFMLRILYTDSIGTIFAATIFMALNGAVSEMIAYYGCQLLIHGHVIGLVQGTEKHLMILVSKLLMFLFIKIMLAMAKRRDRIKLKPEEWGEIFAVPAGSIVILAAMISHNNRTNGFLDILAVLMVLAINVFTYYLYDKMGQIAESRAREEFLQEQGEYYVKQYNENRNLWVEMSEFRHNMSERYLVEKVLLDKRDYEALGKLYDNSLEKLYKQKMAANTGCLYFDSIINYKAAIAKTFGTELKTDLMIPADIKVNTEDICICLGNLLDNAIEACKKLKEERKIALKIRVDRKNLIIIISNPYEEARILEENNYLTTKREKERHGFGLNIVKKIADRYDGEVLIEDTGQEFTVTVFFYGIFE